MILTFEQFLQLHEDPLVQAKPNNPMQNNQIKRDPKVQQALNTAKQTLMNPNDPQASQKLNNIKPILAAAKTAKDSQDVSKAIQDIDQTMKGKIKVPQNTLNQMQVPTNLGQN